MQSFQFDKTLFNNLIDKDYSEIHKPIVDMLWNTGAYLNQHWPVEEELRENANWIINLETDPSWKDSKIKLNVYLPSSGITLYWDLVRKGWYRGSCQTTLLGTL
jgi:hypothetical protein